MNRIVNTEPVSPNRARELANVRRKVMTEFPPAKIRYRFHTWYGRLLMPIRDWLERRCVRYLGRHTKRIKYVNGVRVAVPDEPKTWLGEKVFHITSKLEFRLRKFLDKKVGK